MSTALLLLGWELVGKPLPWCCSKT